MHVVVDDAGLVVEVFNAFLYPDAAKLAKIRGAHVESVHGFMPAVGSLFKERRR